MISLDPRTVIFVNFVYSFIVTIFAVLAWSKNSKKFKGLENWTISFLMFTGNFFIVSFRGIIPVSLVMVLPHLLAGWAYVEIKRGLSHFLEIKNRIYTDFIIMSFYLLALLINTSNAQLRMLSIAFFCMLIMLDTLLLVLQNESVDQETKKIVKHLFSLAIGVQFIRMYLGYKWDPAVNPLDTANNLSSISILFFVVNTIIFFTLLFLVIQRILSEQDQLLSRIKEISITDELTQIYNRRGFLSIISYEFKKLRRQEKAKGYSVALCDIDFFKKVNDLYGHDTGDYVIAELAQLLSSNVRESDVVGRWGGEEFIIYLANLNKEESLVILERIRQSIEAKVFSFKGEKLSITVSIGGVNNINQESDFTEVFKLADENLYYVKEHGRNHVKIEDVE